MYIQLYGSEASNIRQWVSDPESEGPKMDPFEDPDPGHDP